MRPYRPESCRSAGAAAAFAGPVVAGKQHQRIVAQSEFIKGVEHATDLLVHVAYHGVVDLPLFVLP